MDLTEGLPKPLLPIQGRPFLDRLLEQISRQGVERVIILTGYLADHIENYCRDGRKWGLEIGYSEESAETETGYRLLRAAPKLDKQFLLMYCDNYWPMDLSGMWDKFLENPVWAMSTVYTNIDGYTRNNVMVNSDEYITLYDHNRKSKKLNGVEIGYSIVDKKCLEFIPDQNIPFSHSVYPVLAGQGKLKANLTGHRYYSIGSPERLPLTEAFFEPQKAVILDRDGTLNVRPPQAQYVKHWDEFTWLPGSINALKLLKDQGFKIILASNQSGIGRGVMTEHDLSQIHKYMEDDLAKQGVYLDAIYYCPHDWDYGCFCRKPSPGMLFQAQRDFHLDLTNTIFIGDDIRDRETGEAAGCLTALVDEDRALIDVVKDYLKSYLS